MDKIKKIKILSAVSIIGAILAITVAFAIITRSMVINGSGNVNPALWDIHFKDISSPTITGGASVITEPTVADKGAKIDNLEVRLSLPQDKIEYTVYIENSGDMNAKIDDIKYPTLTEEESKIFKFSAKYEKDGSQMQVGDTLYKGQTKKVIITIEYLDISDKNLLPKETKTIDIDFKIKYVQDNNSYADEGNQSLLPEGYTALEYIESDGYQYINTNIVPNSATGFRVKMSSSNVTADKYYSGCRESNSGDDRFVIGLYNGYIYFGYGTTFADTSNWRPEKYEVFTATLNYYNDKVGTYNGRYPKAVKQQTIPNITKSIWLLKANSSQPERNWAMRLYSFEITQGAYLIADFIPALDNNNKPCMYDTVSGNTFYNQGTGEFNYQLK